MTPNIYELRQRAMKGDETAVVELRDLALSIIGHLDALANHPTNAVHEVAKRSLQWPVRWDAIGEKRKADLAHVQRLDIGTEAGIRLEGRREIQYSKQTGFALDVFLELDAIRMNPRGHVHVVDIHPDLAAPGILTEKQLKRSWRNLAALLPPLSKDSIKQWADAGLEFCRDECEGDWSRHPWPDCVDSKAGTVTDENGHERSIESAVRGKISEGMTKLIP